MPSVRRSALELLALADVDAKLTGVSRLASANFDVRSEEILSGTSRLPGRPPRPVLVSPRDLPQRSLGQREGRVALLHALAHIEFNAINLALDAI